MSVHVRGLHGQAVDVIGERIVRGQTAPGDLLYPDQIEAELGVSKTVVREALRVLASKGLIDSRQKRGTFVRPRADWNLLDADVLRWRVEALRRRQQQPDVPRHGHSAWPGAKTSP